MMFRKNIRSSNIFIWLTIPGGIFILFSFFPAFGTFPILAFVGGLLIFLHFFSRFYEKHVDDYLTIDNPDHKVRSYPGDEEHIKLAIAQKGILPIINAKLMVTYDLVLESSYEGINKNRNKTVEIPFTLLSFEKKEISLPVLSKQRGIGKIRGIHIVVPNLLGFGDIELIFNHFYRQEIIIYPSLREVEGVHLLEARNNGDQQAKHSIYEQPLLQYGTRQYVNGDPFNRIHWKATAKRDELQTKVVEKVNQLSWCFVINVKTEYGAPMIQQIERVLEHTAYLCRLATQKQIPYELYINVRGFQGVPYLHLPLGNDQKHLMNTLELLARINPLDLTAPYIQVLKHIDQQNKPPYIIHLGELEDEHISVLSRWKRQGSSVYYVDENDYSAELIPLTKKGGVETHDLSG
ncbi:DUF58 domain-containing protein [Piscibacillus halophilus]|uniref:DUF58 domain-containing protein n=1 Tax=Piscibacillus halophilus TaxID=571933 RepID=A0A1H9AV64_9BACI|nr:DUF58 domain-containing protein [Piscibacillus halophilus]SEP80381.1 Protein of unknown function DUF58 [Piscibacillus halophilus]